MVLEEEYGMAERRGPFLKPKNSPKRELSTAAVAFDRENRSEDLYK